jgi:hypothetical protein
MTDFANEKNPAIYVKGDWAKKILSKEKTIETRSKPLPKVWTNTPLWIIQTGDGPAKIVGRVIFSGYKKYDLDSWEEDADKHCVPINDVEYAWSGTAPKYGWIIADIIPIQPSVLAVGRKDIHHSPAGVWIPFGLTPHD